MTDIHSLDLAQLLTRLWERARDRMIGEGRKPLSVEHIANAVGATRAAVYLWLNGQRVPRPAALEKLAGLFGQDEAERQKIHSQLLAALEAQGRRPDVPPPAFLVSSHIAERERYADHLWVFKWQKRFRSGSDAFLFNELAKIIESGFEEPFPKFHYVFPSASVASEVAALESQFPDYEINKTREDLVAQRSFDDLIEQLKKKFPVLEDDTTLLEKVICRHELTRLADVLYLGIPRVEMIAFFMIEYNADGYDTYGRWVDVFVEIDGRADGSEAGGKGAEGALTYWVALPKELSENMRSNWKTLLDETHQSNCHSRESENRQAA